MSKTERFDTRLPANQKELFLKAAALAGYKNLSDFIINSAQEKAQEILEEEKVLRLMDEDQKVFVDTLLNPPTPNKKLLTAAKKFTE